MSSDCEKIKDQIADLVTGILPEAQVHEPEQHLNECAACRDYARALKDEDMLLTEFFAKIDTNIAHKQERVLQAINHSGVSKQSETHSIWRTIMKSPITKIAAAAVIIIAVVLSINLWNKSTPSAYAFEQTVEAMQGKRSFHIQTYWQSRPKDEFWAEFDENGEVIRYRQEEEEYGTIVTLWEDNIRKRYFPKPIDICLTTRIGNTEPELEDFDPQTTVQKVYEQVAKGKATMNIQQSSSHEGLITITVTPTQNSSRKVLLVDPDTKFVTRVDSYWPNDDEEEEDEEEEEEINFSIEVLEYNQPIDANMFSLNLPESTITIDQVTQQVGMAQGDMSNEKFAPEIIRLALEAWAAGDYAQAGKLFGGPPELLTERYSHLKPVNIISIGQPILVKNIKPIFRVPCKYEVSRDGQIKTVEPRLDATAVDGQPGRWYVNIILNLPKGS